MTVDASRRSARKVGLISTVVIVVVSLVIAALVDPGTFAGPVGTFVLSYLPVHIVLAGMWAHHPDRLSGTAQPARGAVLLVAAIVPVPLLFGGLIILVVFRDSLFGGQPRRLLRGVANVLAMAGVGVLLLWIYQRVAGVVSPPLSWGPPTYQGQVWIASATLSFTFPLLATHADFFDHWPLTRATPLAVGSDAEHLPGI